MKFFGPNLSDEWVQRGGLHEVVPQDDLQQAHMKSGQGTPHFNGQCTLQNSHIS